LVEKDGIGKIVVATGGTSDMPVAEEAALTAEFLGNHVERLYDVGVAGLHRLLDNVDKIMEAKVIIAIADVVGVCMLIDKINPDRIMVSPVHVGSGNVRCAHGNVSL
jgi:pyridinium-3,5-biscarboxylic acid mononucleotide synthase